MPLIYPTLSNWISISNSCQGSICPSSYSKRPIAITMTSVFYTVSLIRLGCRKTITWCLFTMKIQTWNRNAAALYSGNDLTILKNMDKSSKIRDRKLKYKIKYNKFLILTKVSRKLLGKYSGILTHEITYRWSLLIEATIGINN